MILFFSLGILIGLLLFFYGFKVLYELLVKGVVLKSKLSDAPQEIEFNEFGEYFIAFPSKLKVEKNKILITNKESNSIVDIKDVFYGFNFIKNKKKWEEFYRFKIEIKGSYIIEIKNKNEIDNLDFLIAKSITHLHKIIAIFSLVIGFNLTGLCVIALSSNQFQILIKNWFCH